MEKHVKLAEIEVPVDYFQYSNEKKYELCSTVMDAMLTILDRNISRKSDKKQVLNKLIESSIITNTAEENYEICAVLQDIRKILNEPIS
jgi:hypothetical protein